jgi:hypothetical protein
VPGAAATRLLTYPVPREGREADARDCRVGCDTTGCSKGEEQHMPGVFVYYDCTGTRCRGFERSLMGRGAIICFACFCFHNIFPRTQALDERVTTIVIPSLEIGQYLLLITHRDSSIQLRYDYLPPSLSAELYPRNNNITHAIPTRRRRLPRCLPLSGPFGFGQQSASPHRVPSPCPDQNEFNARNQEQIPFIALTNFSSRSG